MFTPILKSIVDLDIINNTLTMPWLRTSFVTLLVVTLCAESCGCLSLKQALQQAMIGNGALLVQRGHVAEADARIRAARSPYWPGIELSGTYTYVSRLSKISIAIPLPTPPPDITTGTHNVLDSKISGRYLLFDWGKRRKTVAKALLGKQISGFTVQATEQSIAYQVTRAYAYASFLGERHRLNERYLEISQKHLDETRSRFENGLESQFELLKSELQLKIYEQQLTIASADLSIATETLVRLIGSGDTKPQISDPLASLAIPVPNFDAARLNRMISSRPDLMALRKKEEIADLAMGLEQLRPTISLFGSAGWKNAFLPDPDKLLFNYTGGIALSYAFFDGGYGKARRAEETAKQETYRKEIADIVEESMTEVKIYRDELAKIEAKMKITEEKLALARKALEIATVSFNTGTITNADYLDTELEIEQIETEVLQDKLSLLFAQLELKRALSYWPEIENQ